MRNPAALDTVLVDDEAADARRRRPVPAPKDAGPDAQGVSGVDLPQAEPRDRDVDIRELRIT